MTRHFNRAGQTTNRKRLRHNATPAEQRLWQRLKGTQLRVKFRRQYSVDTFVIDFYAPAHKLAVEIDGDSHFTPEGLAYDRERTAHLERFGIQVLRFTNSEVAENIEGVVAAIQDALQKRPPLTPPW